MRITHFGSDSHIRPYERMVTAFPGIFATYVHKRIIYYKGEKPWTNDSVEILTASSLAEHGIRTNLWHNTEGWTSVVDENDVGFTMFALDNLSSLFRIKLESYSSKDPRRRAIMISRILGWDVGPKEVLNGHVQIYVGEYQDARKYIYNLRKEK
jgi:hypothetical protein